MEFTNADWIVLALVLLSGLISVVRGFVKEALSLLIWVVAVIVAANFNEIVADWLINLIESPTLRMLAASLGLFFGTLIMGGLINYLIGKLVDSTGLSGTDRLLGLLFGVARGFLIVLALVVILPQALPVDEELWWQQSLLIPHIQQFESWGREAYLSVKDFIVGWI